VLPQAGHTFYLRAHAQLASAENDGSQGVVESTRQFYINDVIFADGFE